MPGKAIDIKGQKFGRWLVLDRVPNSTSRDAKWLCQCECGTRKEVLGKNLRNGRSTSCGCYKLEYNKQTMINNNKARALDLTGEKYGLLTPLYPIDKRIQGSIVWKCQCDCGNIIELSVDALRGAHATRSCGCHSRSLGATYIFNILTDNGIPFITEYSFNDLKNKRYDFAIYDEKNLKDIIRLIEFDGEQHYHNVANWDSVELQQQRDKIKNEYALSHNIPLVRIPYWERDNITLEMIMGDKYLIREPDLSIS